MNALIQFRTTALLPLIALLLACFGLAPKAHAVSPPPDGGYPGNNTAEGNNALLSLTSGTANTAIGFAALVSNTTGFNNTANGVSALANNTTGFNNTATGAFALLFNTTGTANTATGLSALANNTTGNNNTANGLRRFLTTPLRITTRLLGVAHS